MFRTRSHLSDRQLLLSADRELPRRGLSRARSHIADCSSCAARLAQIQGALADLTQQDRHDTATPLPPAFASRAQLARRMTELSRQSPPSTALSVGGWALAGGALSIAGLAIMSLLAGPTTALSRRAVDDAPGVVSLPRTDLTPGMARPVSAGEVCGSGRYGRTEPIPLSVRQGVFERYGADYRRAEDYELDYLITPELGGTPDAANLWPQPYAQTQWNAYVKDELELHLHRLVCEGTIDFATAQREIATDWIAAYKRHFKSDRPLRDYASSPLTEHDGELLRSELEELGLSARAGGSDGLALIAMLRAARPGLHDER